jgi:hypothetical protein
MGLVGALADHSGVNKRPGRSERGPSRQRNRQTELLFSTLQDRVFGSLYRASLDDLPSWLCLEYCRLFRERIDALPRLCGRLLDDYQFGEPGHKEGSRFLEFFVPYYPISASASMTP